MADFITTFTPTVDAEGASRVAWTIYDQQGQRVVDGLGVNEAHARKEAELAIKKHDTVARNVAAGFWRQHSVSEDVLSCPLDSHVGGMCARLLNGITDLLNRVDAEELEPNVRREYIARTVEQVNVWMHG